MKHIRASAPRFALLLCLGASGCGSAPPVATPLPAVSSTIALTSDDRTLWVVNPDADSVSVIDVAARTLLAEVLLGAAHPAVDGATQRYEPAIKPRALAISPDDRTVYVAAQVAGALFVVDAGTRAVRERVAIGTEPTAVVVSADGAVAWVVNHQSATVSRVDLVAGGRAGEAGSARVTHTVPVPSHPWGASLSADGRWLLVSHLLVGAGVTVLDTLTNDVVSTTVLADDAPEPGADKRVPNGVPRGVYVAAVRPGREGEAADGPLDVWAPHLTLAVKTPQPDLDFQSTVFPAISRLTVDSTGHATEAPRLRFQPLEPPGVRGAFSDVISGPRALAFTPDGRQALLVNASSEDVMVFDVERGVERGLLRPLPGYFLEGIAVDRAGRHAYVDGRGSHDITVLTIEPMAAASPSGAGAGSSQSQPLDPAVAALTVEGAPIERLPADPMPSTLRLGQRLFYSANSSAFPLTQNFWVSCASCHIEGGSDAVTWLFTQGPRDTPSNAGGPINTGFLLRQGTRVGVEEYDLTINVEQGGAFDHRDPAQKALLAALSDFVNRAIPLPRNPHRAPGAPLDDSQRRGEALFTRQCASCHPGAWLTDSGAGNPTLDRDGAIVLHDVGTCVTGATGDFPDRPAADEITGRMHTACDFDTPTLRGIFATAPYLHDGSAATLLDVLDRLSYSASMSPGEKADLVHYMETL